VSILRFYVRNEALARASDQVGIARQIGAGARVADKPGAQIACRQPAAKLLCILDGRGRELFLHEVETEKQVDEIGFIDRIE
jgi:hypothetical protein